MIRKDMIDNELNKLSPQIHFNLFRKLNPLNYKYVVFYPPYESLFPAKINKVDFSKTNKMLENGNLSIYVEFPWCASRCPFCLYYKNTYEKSFNSMIKDYFEALKKELLMYNNIFDFRNNKKINHIYFGGGTPSLIPDEIISNFLTFLKENISLKNIQEVSFEIYLPITLKEFTGKYDLLSEYIESKKIRLSLGMQSFKEDVRKRIRGRDLPPYDKELNEIIDFLNGKKHTNCNIDIMWGLLETDVEDELKEIKNKLFNQNYYPSFTFYQIEPPRDVSAYKNFKENIEHDIDKIVLQRIAIFNFMAENGYKEQLLPWYFKKNNQDQATLNYISNQMGEGGYYIGLGVGTHTKLPDKSFINTGNIESYIKKVNNNIFPIEYLAELDKDEQEKRDLLLGLRIPGHEYSEDQLRTLFNDNMNGLKIFFSCNNTSGKYSLNEYGKIFVDEIIRFGIKFDLSSNTDYAIRKISSCFQEYIPLNDGKLRDILDFSVYILGDAIDGLIKNNYVLNIGYKSTKWAAFSSIPLGLIKKKNDWLTLNQIFEGIKGKKLYYFSLLFDKIINEPIVGINLPLELSGKDIHEISELLNKYNFEPAKNKFIDVFSHILSDEHIKDLNDNVKSLNDYLFMTHLFNIYIKEIDENNPKDVALYFLISTSTLSNFIVGSVIAIKKDNIRKEQLMNIQTSFERILNFIGDRINIEEIKEHATKSAAASILMESYAHNIGAHGLEGLKLYLTEQWEKLKKELPLDGQDLECIINELKNGDICKLKDILNTHKNFGEYLWYLQGKSAFWSAVARGGLLFGGKVISLWQLIDEFAKNNLLCGSLGASEGFEGIKYNLKFNSDENLTELFDSTRSGINVKDNSRNDLINRVKKIGIFLPEGIVGQQAVYTIWENIIRNVKHCEKQSDVLIPFCIEINENKNEAYLEISCWLDLAAKNTGNLDEKIKKMNNWDGILDKNQKPNMGGTSQNILCAGMAFGLDFIETEAIQKTEKEEKKKVMRFEKFNDNKVKYYFKLWKGKETGSYSDIAGKDIKEVGPLGRFKLIKLKDKDEKTQLLNNPFFLRHLISTNDDIVTLYETWIKEWFGLNANGEKIIIKIREISGYFRNLDRINELNGNEIISYYFYHGEGQGEDQGHIGKNTINIDYKNDDVIGKLINNIDKQCANENDKIYISELIEILYTGIEIFDRRLYKLANGVTENPTLSDLKVKIFDEEEFVLNPLNQNNERYHFGIFHLSFLELITGQRNDEAIKEFFYNKYNNFEDRYNIIIITTGRGRNWWNGLDNKLRMKIKFIPIENLEYCFDKSLAPKTPSIGIKYALIKTIFGS